MQKLSFFLLLFISFVFCSNSTFAQQDSIQNNSLFLKIDNLNFLKDNEYSNNIADGYTLIGSQLHPKISFNPHPKVKLELGLFALTYAGLNQYHKIIPTFTFSYFMENAQFNIGSYYDKNNHKLIAPLMTDERNLDERAIENGLQYLYKIKNFEIDTWLNWEHFIFRNDTKNEEFILGINAVYSPIQKNNWQLDISLKNLFYHRGGQINTDKLESRNVFTMRHTALGLQLQKNLDSESKLSISSHIIQHQTGEKPEEFFYKLGYGSLTNLDFSFKNWTIGVGYWYGNEFVSPRGDDMFQSVSTKVDYNYVDGEVFEVYTNSNYREPERYLFLGNISYQKEILPNIKFNLKTNFFFQSYYSKAVLIDSLREVENQLDFSLYLTLTYNGNFRLK